MQQIAELLQWGDPGHQPAAMMGQFRRERRGVQVWLFLCLRGGGGCGRGGGGVGEEKFVRSGKQTLKSNNLLKSKTPFFLEKKKK